MGAPVTLVAPTGMHCDWTARGSCRLRYGAIGFIRGGPFGAAAGALAGYNLANAADDAGNTQGLYDGGKANGWDLAGSYANLGLAAGSALAPAASMIGEGLQGAEAAEECASGLGCFVAGTPVQVPTEQAMLAAFSSAGSSTKPIEQIKAGDLVMSRDPKTGTTEARRVESTSVRTVPIVVTVHLADTAGGQEVASFTCTKEHPVFVDGKGFVPARALGIGNAIVTRAGPVLIVSSVEWHSQPGGYEVYNLVVEGDHSYFVGNSHEGAWVHNGFGPCGQLDLPFDDLPPQAEEIHHIATNKNFAKPPFWSERFQPLFDRFGISMNDPDNLVSLAGHSGPHPPDYHAWVHGLLNQANDAAEFRGTLRGIGAWLQQNPGLLNTGPYPPSL